MVSIVLIIKFLIFVTFSEAMTMKQIKQTGKMMRKTCQPKNNVEDEKIDPIQNGVFIEEKEVMCYIACIMKMANAVKNGKLNFDAALKQADMLLPEEVKEPAKAAITACRKVGEIVSKRTQKYNIMDGKEERLFVRIVTSAHHQCSSTVGHGVSLATRFLLQPSAATDYSIYIVGLAAVRRSAYQFMVSIPGSILRGDADCPEFVAQLVRLSVPPVSKYSFRPRANHLLAVPSARTVSHRNSPLIRALFRGDSDKYKDVCEASFYSTKCIYNHNPEIFFFP